MSETQPTATTPTTTEAAKLVQAALTPFRALFYSGIVAVAFAALLLFIAMSESAIEPALIAGLLLFVAAPLFAGAGIIAALGKRQDN